MYSDNRGNYQTQPPPIYTVSGAYPAHVNYGFSSAPPPKYEDAVRGTPMEQPLPAHEGPQPTTAYLVSPVYTEEKKSSNTVSAVLVVFFFLFISIYIFTRMRI